MSNRLITMWFVVIMCFIGFIGVLPIFQQNAVWGISLTTWLFIIGYWILPFIVILYTKIMDDKQKTE